MPASSSIRVLVVDDCRDAVASLRILLGLWGHEVAGAYDGAEALRVAETFRPNVVLLDLVLPRLDGCEVARRLRELPGLASALIVATTGLGQEQDVRRAREAGCNTHLLKPFDLSELERLLTSVGA
jgi:CheY-like chemotaxis protein